MHGIFITFLCHHGEYSCEVLHTVEIFTWGLGFYNAVMGFLFFFSNAMPMQKSKYAKVKIIHEMQKGENGLLPILPLEECSVF